MKESELILRCKKEDRIAQELVFERYADKMFRVAIRYVKDVHEAEDVLIVALNKVFSSIKGFTSQGEGSLEGWIRRIVVNESLMSLRKKHNFNLTEITDQHMPEPELDAFSQLDAEMIQTAIDALPMGYRTVFNLNVVEGFPHEEISKMLNISVGTSRSQLFKAKSILKKSLSEEGLKYGN